MMIYTNSMFFFSSRRRHTRWPRDWSSDVCSSDLSYELGNTVRILSLPIMISASMLGFAGIVLSFLFIVIHLCRMESFGVAYLSPLAPLHIRELVDAIARFPIWMLRKRPAELRTQKTEKQGKSREWFYDAQ